MGENTFWAVCWTIAGAVFIAFFAAIWDYHKDQNSRILEALNNGVNPVAIKCAFQDDLGQNPVCLVLATKEKTQ